MKNILNTLKTNRKKGFTLVEMIIVIVIIAILAAIAIPAMKGYIQDANEATAIANCRTALMASEATAPMIEADEVNATDNVYMAEMSSLLGEELPADTDATDGRISTTFSEGTLTATYTAGSGTDAITWTDADGNTAYWEEGMTAPEIQE